MQGWQYDKSWANISANKNALLPALDSVLLLFTLRETSMRDPAQRVSLRFVWTSALKGFD